MRSWQDNERQKSVAFLEQLQRELRLLYDKCLETKADSQTEEISEELVLHRERSKLLESQNSISERMNELQDDLAEATVYAALIQIDTLKAKSVTQQQRIQTLGDKLVSANGQIQAQNQLIFAYELEMTGRQERLTVQPVQRLNFESRPILLQKSDTLTMVILPPQLSCSAVNAVLIRPPRLEQGSVFTECVEPLSPSNSFREFDKQSAMATSPINHETVERVQSTISPAVIEDALKDIKGKMHQVFAPRKEQPLSKTLPLRKQSAVTTKQQQLPNTRVVERKPMFLRKGSAIDLKTAPQPMVNVRRNSLVLPSNIDSPSSPNRAGPTVKTEFFDKNSPYYEVVRSVNKLDFDFRWVKVASFISTLLMTIWSHRIIRANFPNPPPNSSGKHV